MGREAKKFILSWILVLSTQARISFFSISLMSVTLCTWYTLDAGLRILIRVLIEVLAAAQLAAPALVALSGIISVGHTQFHGLAQHGLVGAGF